MIGSQLIFVFRNILVGVLLSLAALGPAAAQKRVALVIGVAAYAELPALHNPVSDARAIATLLEANGIATTVLPNPTHAQMLVALARFRRITEDADLALVYYAGHGLNLAGADVLLPSDTPVRCDPKTREEALVGTVGIDEVIAAARPARNRVIILDACRTAAFPSCPSRGDATVAFRALGRAAEEHRGTLIATSAATGGVASDGPRGGHSPYNALLRQHLAGKPQSFLHEVLFDVNRELGSRPSGQQPSLHFAHGIPPAVCLKVEGCGQSPEEIENARLRAKIEELQRAQVAQAQKHAALQVPAKEAADELARKKAAEEQRRQELRQAEEVKRKAEEATRAEALRKSKEDAERAGSQREAKDRAAAEKKVSDERQKASEAAKAMQESKRTVVAALPKAEKQTTQGNFDGRWIGNWTVGGGAAGSWGDSTTIIVSGNRVIRYYVRGKPVPITHSSTSGNVVTFGSGSYTVVVTFREASIALASYRLHNSNSTLPLASTFRRQ